MNTYTSLAGLITIERPNTDFARLSQAGFQNAYMDFDMVCSAGVLRTLGNPNFKSNFLTRAVEDPTRLNECVTPLFESASNHSININIAKAPTLLLDTRRTDLNDIIVTLTKESIKACGANNVQYLVVAPLFVGIDDADMYKVNKDFYLSLVTLAREHGVTILLENQCKDMGGHLVRGMFTDIGKTRTFIDELNEAAGDSLFAFAYNVGNANICTIKHYEFLTALDKYIKVIFVSDNDGQDISHLLPFSATGKGASSTDWLNLIRGVRAIDFDGEVVFDYANSASALSILLRGEFLRYAKAVADHLVWQFGIERDVKSAGKRVLFGAGNMCRNYMKNYGKDYPPLYTCDNNSANWGNTFEGLEIKNPEELKNLDEDVTIFICNMYYSEIDAQLREMGLKNPIKYFNDEYMPTFHFERLDMSTF